MVTSTVIQARQKSPILIPSITIITLPTPLARCIHPQRHIGTDIFSPKRLLLRYQVRDGALNETQGIDFSRRARCSRLATRSPISS
jgi:hypothetical protein